MQLKYIFIQFKKYAPAIYDTNQLYEIRTKTALQQNGQFCDTDYYYLQQSWVTKWK